MQPELSHISFKIKELCVIAKMLLKVYYINCALKMKLELKNNEGKK